MEHLPSIPRLAVLIALLAVGGALSAAPPPATVVATPSLIAPFPGYFYQWPRQRFSRAYGPRVSDHPGYHLRAWRARFDYSYRDGRWRR